MKPKLIPVLEDCIEVGLKLGINRAHKHIDNPTDKQICEQQHAAIMAEIWERFDFEEIK
jgi:hypothetical protein